jgi:hypothetical protein
MRASWLPAAKETEASEGQLEKAYCAIEVRELGIETEDREEQDSKAKSAIVTIEEGISTDDREMHFWNTNFPNMVTVVGIEILERLEQSENADPNILETVVEITTD